MLRSQTENSQASRAISDIMPYRRYALPAPHNPFTPKRDRFRSAFGLISLCSVPLALAGCQKKATPPQLLPQSVGIMTLQTQPVTLETSLPGRTDAYEQAQIRPQVNGVIVSRDFEQGADVKKGQQLFQIYIAPYQAAYDQAKAQLMNAQEIGRAHV